MKQAIFVAAVVISLAGCAGNQPRQDDSLYRQLGGDIGIDNLVVTSIQMLHKDERIAFLFEETEDANLVEQLNNQLCFLSGGPCTYDGLSMQDAHAGMELTEAEFDVFVEIFIDAMTETGIPFSAQNQLLAILAPMRPDIIHQ